MADAEGTAKKRDGPEGPPRTGSLCNIAMQALLEFCYDNGKGTLFAPSLLLCILWYHCNFAIILPAVRPAVPRLDAVLFMEVAEQPSATRYEQGRQD